MTTYKIIGLKSEEQAQRIKGRFCDALGNDTQVKIDLDRSEITLPNDISPYTISLISSFEQISIVSPETIEDIQIANEDEGHHQHEHGIEEGETAQRNILVVFFLNLFFSVAEFFFGALFSSQAILSDAVHDLGDALSIGLAYFFEKISNRGTNSEYSYGYRRFSLLGGLVTSVILIIGGGLVIFNTLPVLFDPTPVDTSGVFWVAIAAILINGFSVWLMSRGESANEKILNIHLFEDLFGWISVLAMSIILNFTDWYILDPIISIGIAGWILYATIPEFIRVSKIFLQAVPENVDPDKLRADIQEIDQVNVISHFHIWSQDGQQHMMSITVTTDSNDMKTHENIKQHIRQSVLEYNITHITIEVLYDPDHLIKQSINCEG